LKPGSARLALALVALAVPSVAAAQTKAPLPEFIRKSFAEDAADCRSAGGRISLPATADTAFLNGDALPDYLVDLGEVRCTAFGSGSGYCGSAGCAVGVWMSMPGGYRQVAAENLQAWRVDRSVRPNRIVARMHGSFFGRSGADGGEVALAWNGTDLVPVKAAARPAAAPAVGGAAAPTGFAIRVTLSPQAVAWLQRQGDQPLVEVVYSGNPRRSAPAQLVHPADGVILLGDDRIPLPMTGGAVRATGAGLDTSLLRHVQGPVEASVLVRQAREPRSAMDVVGYLNCAPEGPVPLATLQAKGLALSCGPP
jgi:hypothetical protein